MSRLLRYRTLAGGTGLGLLMLAGLTLAGSLSAMSTPHPVPEAEVVQPLEPGTLSASQPPPGQAVSRPNDLPDGTFARTSVGSPKVAGQRPRGPERCSLILDPGSLLRDTHTAAAAFREIQRVTKNCLDFQAVLEDGTPVRVHLKANPIDENTYALRLTLTGGGRVSNGVLTVRRAGQVLSVLGELSDNGIPGTLKLVDVMWHRLTQGAPG